MAKNLMRKKLYLIVSIDFGSKTLAILGNRVIMKLNSVTHQVKPGEAQ